VCLIAFYSNYAKLSECEKFITLAFGWDELFKWLTKLELTILEKIVGKKRNRCGGLIIPLIVIPGL